MRARRRACLQEAAFRLTYPGAGGLPARRDRRMNTLRTAMLIAVMTAIFMGVGYLIGGPSGMAIAFLVAAGMNFFAYWNADKLVLASQRAREVDARSAPELVGLVRDLTTRAGLPMPRVYVVE